jgi:hypothetical protein
MAEVDPRNALEKLLEVRFHMQRAAWVQREMVRLKPETRQPYANDPNMRVAREPAGLTVEGSMAEDLLGLATRWTASFSAWTVPVPTTGPMP